MHVVLYQPEIPPNTGNVARLCAASGITMHLIEPLGFSLDDKYLKRAGLDYWPHVRQKVWPDFAGYLKNAGNGRRLVMTSARQGEPLHHFVFQKDDALVFGPETRGLPEEIFALASRRIRIPIKGAVRSLNLSTAVGITLYFGLSSSGLLDEMP